jgi:hypothetical protein
MDVICTVIGMKRKSSIHWILESMWIMEVESKRRRRRIFMGKKMER